MKVSIKVQPRASKNKIIKNSDGSLKVYLTQAPESGRANKALIEILAEYYSTSKSNIKIISGLTSRSKIVEVSEAKSRAYPALLDS